MMKFLKVSEAIVVVLVGAAHIAFAMEAADKVVVLSKHGVGENEQTEVLVERPHDDASGVVPPLRLTDSPKKRRRCDDTSGVGPLRLENDPREEMQPGRTVRRRVQIPEATALHGPSLLAPRSSQGGGRTDASRKSGKSKFQGCRSSPPQSPEDMFGAFRDVGTGQQSSDFKTKPRRLGGKLNFGSECEGTRSSTGLILGRLATSPPSQHRDRGRSSRGSASSQSTGEPAFGTPEFWKARCINERGWNINPFQLALNPHYYDEIEASQQKNNPVQGSPHRRVIATARMPKYMLATRSVQSPPPRFDNLSEERDHVPGEGVQAVELRTPSPPGSGGKQQASGCTSP